MNPQVGEPVFNPGGGPGPQFTPSGLNCMVQKPGSMPPPSPATNGLGPGGNNNPGSPRNSPPLGGASGGGGGGGTAPATPVPVSQSIPQQQQQMGNQNSLNPSPAAMMGVVPTGSGPGGALVGGGAGPQPDLNMFNSEFMNNITTSLQDFAGFCRNGRFV
jgi:hypothetical protein